jgi:hypothetical protein
MRALAPVGGVVLALGLLLATRGLDDVAREGQLGPGFWPRLVLGGLAAACAIRLVVLLRPPLTAPLGAASAFEVPPMARGRLGGALALIFLYVAATPLLGFPLTTTAFIAGFMALAGARSRAGIAAAAVAGTVALLYLFVKLVYLPLPKGDGPFEAVTIALYRALGIF